jgi:hypothetical protein
LQRGVTIAVAPSPGSPIAATKTCCGAGAERAAERRSTPPQAVQSAHRRAAGTECRHRADQQRRSRDSHPGSAAHLRSIRPARCVRRSVKGRDSGLPLRVGSLEAQSARWCSSTGGQAARRSVSHLSP